MTSIEANTVDETVDIRLEEMSGPWNQADDPRWFVLGTLLLDWYWYCLNLYANPLYFIFQ